MPSFIAGSENNQEIRKLLEDGSNLKCAVAFLGREALTFFEKTKEHTKLICNLESGATNPYVISKLIKNHDLEIRTNSKLHAKVYWTSHKAIVSSANISINGLGLEGIDGWIEAGIVVDAENIINKIKEWFNDLWRNSNKIDKRTLAKAYIKWRKRNATHPKSSSNNRKIKKPNELDLLSLNGFPINFILSEYTEEILQEKDYTTSEIQLKIKNLNPELYDKIIQQFNEAESNSNFGKRVDGALHSLKEQGKVVKTSKSYGSTWRLV